MDDQRENEAVQELTRALAFKPDLQMLHLRAAFHESMGDYVSALRDCEAALCLDPDHKDTFDLYYRIQGGVLNSHMWVTMFALMESYPVPVLKEFRWNTNQLENWRLYIMLLIEKSMYLSPTPGCMRVWVKRGAIFICWYGAMTMIKQFVEAAHETSKEPEQIFKPLY